MKVDIAIIKRKVVNKSKVVIIKSKKYYSDYILIDS